MAIILIAEDSNEPREDWEKSLWSRGAKGENYNSLFRFGPHEFHFVTTVDQLDHLVLEEGVRPTYCVMDHILDFCDSGIHITTKTTAHLLSQFADTKISLTSSTPQNQEKLLRRTIGDDKYEHLVAEGRLLLNDGLVSPSRRKLFDCHVDIICKMTGLPRDPVTPR